MKPVHPGCRNSGLTMTVGELLEYLKPFDPETPVIATWEGVYAGIRFENFELDELDERDGRMELVVDVEEYG